MWLRVVNNVAGGIVLVEPPLLKIPGSSPGRSIYLHSLCAAKWPTLLSITLPDPQPSQNLGASAADEKVLSLIKLTSYNNSYNYVGVYIDIVLIYIYCVYDKWLGLG